MKIRSITVFSDIDSPIKTNQIETLGAFTRQAQRAFESAGYEVQTTRLATHMSPDVFSGSESRLLAFARDLETVCLDEALGYISLGPIPHQHLKTAGRILAETHAVFVNTHIVNPTNNTIDGKAIHHASQFIQQAAHLEAGFGNLRFAALASVPPGVPFFPAAYYGGNGPSFALALESADLAVDACNKASDAESARVQLSQAIEYHAARLTTVAHTLTETHQIPFGGLDFSLAPFPKPDISIGAAIEALSGHPVGMPGTLSAAALLTEAIDRAKFPHTGFCGLMLPVLEDNILAQRAAEGHLGLGELLQWSAVCGTGLDTVPIPGDVGTDTLARILFDVAALALRLHKPLTARLMPLPGKSAGDPAQFDFAYFAPGGVLAVPDTANPTGRLLKTQHLHLSKFRDKAQHSP